MPIPFFDFSPVITIGYHEKFENKCFIFQNTWPSQRKISACSSPPTSLWLSGSGKVLATSVDTRCMSIQQTNMGTNNIA
jgi:hypothetical protein